MVEAAAVVGLVASIASLIDLGVKVAARLREFTSQTSEVPESLRALSTRLPLLTSSLRAISSQAQAGHLPHDVVNALQAVITARPHKSRFSKHVWLRFYLQPIRRACSVQ